MTTEFRVRLRRKVEGNNVAALALKPVPKPDHPHDVAKVIELLENALAEARKGDFGSLGLIMIGKRESSLASSAKYWFGSECTFIQLLGGIEHLKNRVSKDVFDSHGG